MPSTVRETLKRVAAAGLEWPLPEEMSDGALEAALYREPGNKTGYRRCAEPDWPRLHREMQRKHVTLQILWDEYIAAHPDGYRYSRFCDLYRGWALKLAVTMRQHHEPGDKLFVDYAGDRLSVVDRLTGEVRDAHIFVAVLGASSLTYAEATWTETLADWISVNVNALEAFGGAPALLVPDNAKVAVIKACLYDPWVNRSYAEMAAHYGSAVLPARPRKPRDKAKVERAVLIVERWLFGRLRRRTFYSLAELNAAIRELVADLNDTRVLRHLGQTRVSCSRSWTDRRSRLCRRSATSMRSGVAGGRASTIMSRSSAIITRCHIASRASPSRRGSRRVPSSCSTRASASRRICAAQATAAIRPRPSICRRHIAASPIGRLSGSAARRPPSALALPCCARGFSSSARIPNRASAPAWASCAW